VRRCREEPLHALAVPCSAARCKGTADGRCALPQPLIPPPAAAHNGRAARRCRSVEQHVGLPIRRAGVGHSSRRRQLQHIRAGARGCLPGQPQVSWRRRRWAGGGPRGGGGEGGTCRLQKPPCTAAPHWASRSAVRVWASPSHICAGCCSSCEEAPCCGRRQAVAAHQRTHLDASVGAGAQLCSGLKGALPAANAAVA
jgi:hypothetical protein